MRFALTFLFILSGLALAQMPVLTSVPVAAPPIIDGNIGEDFWSDAPILEIITESAGYWEATNNSATTVTLRSVYSGDHVYFLVTWLDPSYSVDRQRWVFDGTAWAEQDKTPLKDGGANTYYEDKVALQWVISAPTIVEDETFYGEYQDEEEGPALGYDRPVKTAPEGERLDMWHFKYVRTNFTTPPQVDDQFVDDRRDPNVDNDAGRHSDAQGEVEGGYYNNTKEYTAADGSTVKGPKYYVPGNSDLYILTQAMVDAGEAVEIADYEELMGFAPDTKIAGVVGRALTGSRGDITGKATWRDGMYVLEFGRALDTGDLEHDVIFKDLVSTYYFGIATFDNAQIAHGVSDVIQFVFQK